MCTLCSSAPNHLDLVLEDLNKVSGLRDIHLHIAEVGSLVSSGHRKLSKVERATALGIGTSSGATFEQDFAIARRQLVRARQTLRRTLQSETWNEIRKAVNPAGGPFSEALKEVRSVWVDGLLEADTGGVAVGEIVDIFDMISRVVQGEGFDGLADYLDGQLAELERELSADRSWGRQPHSPLEWWEYVVIAWLLSSVVFGVAACYWWSDCSWVRAALRALCQTIALIDGLAYLRPTCAWLVLRA
jgi:hypothetical protein